jgi:uracil-DNA glycosylase
MRGTENTTITSYLDWWTDVGIGDPVQDDPFQWLQPLSTAGDPEASNPAPQPCTINPISAAAPVLAAAPTAAQVHKLPDDLAAFDNWLRDDPSVPGALWSSPRILPTGPAGAPLLVLSDMPDADDVAAGHLLAGPVGALFDAILVAIGRNRSELRLGSIALTRPAGGQWDNETASALREIALHHINLASPQRILLLGQLTCRLLTGQDVPADGHGLRNINHYGVTTATTAIHHPRLLLTRQTLKRGAWSALKSLREPA